MSDPRPDVRNWQSVRTVLEALILAALLWSAKVQMTVLTQMAVLQDNVISIRAQLADVPGLNQRTTTLEVKVAQAQQDITEMRQMRGLK